MQQIGINTQFPDPAISSSFKVLAHPPPIPRKILCNRDKFESALSKAYAALLWMGML
jgi:hypothetical protein